MRLVNTNWILESTWSFFKRLNNKKTVAKMSLYGPDSKILLYEMKKDIDTKYIPKKLGGENDV